jgi:ketosteroid isomerase-like protein
MPKMACTTKRVSYFAAGLLVSLSVTRSAIAQPLTAAMVESHVKEWLAAFASNDPEKAARADPPTNGFGWRALKARSAEMQFSTWLETQKTFFAGMDYYRVQLNEVQAAVDGNIGLAWGFFTEDFKRKGHAPEKARVRFTTTLKYERGSWRTLLYHRDIQKFDEKGNYLPGQ